MLTRLALNSKFSLSLAPEIICITMPIYFSLLYLFLILDFLIYLKSYK